MSEQIENPRAATGGMSDVLREQLHRREEVCCKLEALPQSAAEDYPARLEALRTEWNSLPEIPPEYAEILDKRCEHAAMKDNINITTANRSSDCSPPIVPPDTLDIKCHVWM